MQTPNASRIISQHTFQGDEHILDLGCGEGTLTANLLEPLVPRGSVVGIDKSPRMIEEATSLFPHMRFIEGDILNLSAVLASHDLPRKFDVIFSNFALHWMGNELGHAVVLELIRAHLAPGGIALLSFPSRDTFQAY